MIQNKRNFNLLENVEIIDAGSEGMAVGKAGEIVVFVPYLVPGDVADIQVIRKKRSFIEGKAVKIHKFSESRITPVCSHFGVCGGCKWQNMTYKKQLQYKQKQVTDNFKRIGGIKIHEIFPVIPATQTEYYRNKLEFTFSNNRWLTLDEIENGNIAERKTDALGFHVPGRFDKVIDIERCYLQKDPSNSIRLAVKEYAVKNKLIFFDIRKQVGFLRNLIIRTSDTGDIMVIFVFFYDDPAAIEDLLKSIGERFPEITSLQYVINEKKNDSIADLDVTHYKGKDHIIEDLDGLRLRIGPKSFFQTNTTQAKKLYQTVLSLSGLTKDEVVYDLYTGSGAIANYIAGKVKKVVGIEYVPEAIEDAKINAEWNNIYNASFYCGDINIVMNDKFIAENGLPDVIITDPPRAGMHKDVVKKISEICPASIIYVSCNSATQARDISMLYDMYSVEKVQPVDMFPHTAHIENAALLVKR